MVMLRENTKMVSLLNLLMYALDVRGVSPWVSILIPSEGAVIKANLVFFPNGATLSVQLQGRLYTWSNNNEIPNFDKLDRVFISS